MLAVRFISPAQQQYEHAFMYPVPPESLVTLQDRSSYLVEHFWDRCNMKSIFSSRKNLEQSMDDYFSFMVYADSAVVMNSIDRLIKEVKKSGPNMLTMAEIARAKLYSDSAEYRSDELYLPFAKAGASASGVSKEQKAAYQLEISQLENSLVGKYVPDVSLTLRDGSVHRLHDYNGNYFLIFFDEPDDFDNMMARVKLSTDYGLNDLITKGQVQVICITPGKADDEWKARVADYPQNWIVAAAEGTDQLFDRRVKPSFYYLNRDKIILSKTLVADNLIEAFRMVRNSQNRIREERERLKQEALKQREMLQKQEQPMN